MKVRIEYTGKEEKEVVIRCPRADDEVLRIKELIEGCHEKLSGILNGEVYLFPPEKVLYFESVDNKVFAYMEDKVVGITDSLEHLEERLRGMGFLRCSKSMIVNFNFIEKFKSSVGHRITATLTNGEEVIVSRHYSKYLRIFLKGEPYEK